MEIKGILHCHSTHSYDAKLSLPELKALLQQNGVRVACMTEHTDELTKDRAQAFIQECEKLSDDTFMFIPGFEVPYKRTHILLVGMREFFGSYAPELSALKLWTRKASFVVLAHPVRNAFMVEDGLLEQIDALEVWNQQYDGKRVPRTRSLRLLEKLRIKKETLLATGGVDFHRKEHFGAPIVTLSVDTFTESAIIEKLKMGAYVISSPHATFFGTLPNISEIIQKHWFDSRISVSIVFVGKWVNRTLRMFGISFPKSFKQLVRKRI